MHEQTDQPFPVQLHDQHHHTGQRSHSQHAVTESPADAVRFPGAHVLARIGGQCHAHGAERLLDQLLKPVGGGVGRHGRRAERIDHCLQRGGGNGDQAPLKRQRQPQPECTADDFRIIGHHFSTHSEIRVHPERIHQRAGTRQQL